MEETLENRSISVEGENGEISTNDSDIRQRWKEYFNELLNVESPSEMEELKSVEETSRCHDGGGRKTSQINKIQ